MDKLLAWNAHDSTQNIRTLPTGVLCGTRSNSCTILMSSSSKDSKSYRKKHDSLHQKPQNGVFMLYFPASDPINFQISLFLFVSYSEAGFPITYIHVTDYGTQIRAARGKVKYSLFRGQRITQPCDSSLRILVCPAHIVTVPDTNSIKYFCYMKLNILFLKI